MDDIDICVFDAYGTLYDFNSAVARHRDVVGPKADALSAMWRTKQIEYTWLRNSMGAYAPFWQVTGEALVERTAERGVLRAHLGEVVGTEAEQACRLDDGRRRGARGARRIERVRVLAVSRPRWHDAADHALSHPHSSRPRRPP